MPALPSARRLITHRFELRTRASFALSACALLCSLVLLQGCTVKLIASYDEQVDESLMNLQRSFSELFVTLEDTVGTPASAYDNYREFYRQVKVDAAALKLRVDAQPLNDLSSQAVGLVIENIELLEEVHKEGINDMELVSVIRDDFTTSLTSLLRLELAKQRGDL